MAKVCVTVTISFRWWLCIYLNCVALTSRLTGLEPDSDQVGKWIARGIKLSQSS